MRLLSLVLSLVLPAALALAEDVETFSCDSTDGFSVVDLPGQPPSGAQLSSSGGEVILRYDRARLVLVQHTALLTDLTSLALQIRSDVATTLLVVTEDRDHARFQATIELPSGPSRRVTLLPSQFRLAEDSPTAKAALDPHRLGADWALADIGAAFGASGPNTLSIDEVLVGHTDLPVHQGDLLVDGSTTVRDGLLVRGSVIVKGGVLDVVGCRLAVEGSVTLDQGSMHATDGAVIELRGRFSYDAVLACLQGSLLQSLDALVSTRSAGGIYVGDGATVTLARTRFVRGFTWDARPAGAITLQEVVTPGEFITSSKAILRLSDSVGILFWMYLGADARGSIAFPTADRVDSWDAGAGFRVHMERCSGLIFALIAQPGCEVDVQGSRLAAAGATFEGCREYRIDGLSNPYEGASLAYPADDRTLRFLGCRVNAWNFYTAGSARLVLTHCVYGESHAGDWSQVTAEDSTCDGSGGFIQASDHATITMRRCRVTTLVQARQEASVLLEDCTIDGEIVAAEDSTIRLVRCRVTGAIRQVGNGRVIQE